MFNNFTCRHSFDPATSRAQPRNDSATLESHPTASNANKAILNRIEYLNAHLSLVSDKHNLQVRAILPSFALCCALQHSY